MHLTHCSAVVTGAASGLGAATARRLAEGGAAVVGVDLDVGNAPEVDGVTYVTGDVTSEQDIRAAVAAASERGSLRVAVNCAGIGPAGRVLNRDGIHDLGAFAAIVKVNLVGTFTVMAVAAEAMRETAELAHGQRGVVVNTASIAAYEGQVGQVAYASSKGGVVGMTLPAARDLAQWGIRVNTIAPGIIDTPLLATVDESFRATLAAGVPFPRRLGLPEEYADLVAFVVAHDYLNGEVIRMDGALRMAPR